MYSTVIEIKKDISDDRLRELTNIIEQAFNNRVGKVKNTGTDVYNFTFRSPNTRDVLELGILNLAEDRKLLDCVQNWKWIDEDPDESCDVLQIFLKPVRE